VQFYTIQRQIKRNGESIYLSASGPRTTNLQLVLTIYLSFYPGIRWPDCSARTVQFVTAYTG
jgi:hypothetical protein